MFRFVYIILITSLCTHTYSQTENIMTLKEAVDYGIEHHTLISIGEQQVSYQEWQLMSKKSHYLPAIQASADYRYNTNLPVTIIPANAFGGDQSSPREITMGTKNAIQTGINMEQPVYDPVALSGIRESAILKKISKVDVSQVRKEVVLKIKRAYYRVLYSKDKLRISKELEQSYTQLQDIVRNHFDHGLAEAMAVQEVKKKQDNQSREVEINRMNLQNNLQRLKLAMEYPSEKNLHIAENSIYQIIDTMSLEGRDNFEYKKLPEYRQLNLELAMNREKSGGIDAQYLPSLTAYGFIGIDFYDDVLNPFGNDERWFRQSYLGAKLKIPIFDGWNKNRRQQALNIHNQQLTQERDKLGYTLQIREDILGDALVIAIQRSAMRKNDYEWALTQYENKINDYNNGLASYNEVVQSGLELQIEQQEYLAAMLDAIMSKIDYEELTENYD